MESYNEVATGPSPCLHHFPVLLITIFSKLSWWLGPCRIVRYVDTDIYLFTYLSIYAHIFYLTSLPYSFATWMSAPSLISPCTGCRNILWSLPIVFGKISQSEELCLALESVEWISFLFCANSLVCWCK